jgi:hypothetical protein
MKLVVFCLEERPLNAPLKSDNGIKVSFFIGLSTTISKRNSEFFFEKVKARK